MKKLLLILAITPVVAFSQDKNKLIGNWKEVMRMPAGSKTATSFNDTIKLEFLIGNEYVWQKKGGFIYKGAYKLNKSELDMGARSYTIVKQDDNSMTIKNETSTHELVRYTPTSEQTVLPPEPAAKPVKSLDQMKGNWSVFKGKQDKTVSEIDYKRKIKKLEITGDIAGDGKLGMVFGSKDAETAPSWYIESYSNQTLHVNGKDKRTLHVLKCENNELVIEEDGFTYFLRQFR